MDPRAPERRIVGVAIWLNCPKWRSVAIRFFPRLSKLAPSARSSAPGRWGSSVGQPGRKHGGPLRPRPCGRNRSPSRRPGRASLSRRRRRRPSPTAHRGCLPRRSPGRPDSGRSLPAANPPDATLQQPATWLSLARAARRRFAYGGLQKRRRFRNPRISAFQHVSFLEHPS